MKETPASVTYASVVSRESVSNALTLAALNNLQVKTAVKTADIENAYLTAAPVSEKIWYRLGPVFGAVASKKAMIELALYGNHLVDCMRYLGWESCKADQDVRLKPDVRKDNGYQYYAYCLLYVDDILVVHHDGVRALNKRDHIFKTTSSSIQDPEFYLGAKLRPITLSNGVHTWAMSSSTYIQAAVENAKAFHSMHLLPNTSMGKTE
jgi:hypothetical protein